MATHSQPPLALELQQVLDALQANREPGWHFPGHFLDLSFEPAAPDRSRVLMASGPHCTAAHGAMSLPAVTVLADMAMAEAVRNHAGRDASMATVSITLQFTGAPLAGELDARGSFDGYFEGPSGRNACARLEMSAEGRLACTAAGTFHLLAHRGLTLPPVARAHARSSGRAPLGIDELRPDERALFERAQAAAAADGGAFIERFWGLLPERSADGARCELPCGGQASNRNGHVHGGVLLAMAASTAGCALGDAWRLAGVSSWFIRPGVGVLRSDAEIVHRGRGTAVVRARVCDAAGRLVLEATSSHLRVHEG